MTMEQIQDIVMGTIAAAHDAGDLVPPQQMQGPIMPESDEMGREEGIMARQEEAQQARPMPNVVPQEGQA
jgi:hypothetical protein